MQPARIQPHHFSAAIMYLYEHHSASKIISLDDESGDWSPLPESDEEPFVGAASIVMRFNVPVRGSYTIEDQRHHCFYWNDIGQLVFSTPREHRFCLFQRQSDGTLVDLMPNLTAEYQPAIDVDGGPVSGMSTFGLRDGSDITLFEVSYDSMRYRELHAVNSVIAFVPDESLRDWDFFLAVKYTIDELKMIARACTLISLADHQIAAQAAAVMLADTGSLCPCAGLWTPCRHLDVWRAFSLGEEMPDVEGRPETWVRVQIEP